MKVVKKKIDMLCWFDKEGSPHPLRFRIANEEGSVKIVKVDRIIKKNLEKLAGNKMIVFTCQSNINDINRIYELKYEQDTCRWMLFKI